MKFWKFFFASAFLTLILSPSSYAVKYSGIYAFGDSLSADEGPYAASGLVWPQYLNDSMTLPGSVYQNYAFPGARVEQILDTVKQYLASNTKADPSAIYALWGGTNNDNTGSSGNIGEAVSLLSAAGARNIVVLNLHPNPRRSDGYVIGYNTRMRNQLNTLSANVIQVDDFTLFNEMYDDPTAYGFASSTAVLSDGLHFHTQTHRIISDYVVSVMEAPTLISLLPEVALPFARNHHSSISAHLGGLKGNSRENAFIPWVSYLSGNGDGEGGDLTADFDRDSMSILAGVDFQWQENFIVGLNFEKRQAEGDFGNNRGHYDVDTTLTSLSSLLSLGKFFVQGILTKGSLGFNEVSRTVPLGIAKRTMTGSPNGDITAWTLSLGVDLLQADQNSHWTVGPIASLSQQKVTVDGYSEVSPELSTSMNFEGQEQKSLLISGGLLASYDTETSMGALRASTHVLFEKESEDTERTIRGGVNTLAGSSFSMPGVLPESNATRFGVSLQSHLLHGITGQIGFELRNGDTSSDKSIRVEVRKAF